MTNNDNFFEVRCRINHGGELVISLPMTVHYDFERTVKSQDEKLMSRLVELFGEYRELDEIKRVTFQTLVEERAEQLSTLDDLLDLLKAVRICTAFFEK